MIGTILLAAGKGRRFGELKQFKNYKGYTPYDVVYEKFSKRSERIITVMPDAPPNEFNLYQDHVCVPGEDLRLDSIKNGLEPLAEDDAIDKVIIAESVRPLIEEKLIDEMIDAARAFEIVIVYSPSPYVTMVDQGVGYRGYYHSQEVWIHKPRGRVRIIQPPSMWEKRILVDLMANLKPRICSSQVPAAYAPLLGYNILWLSARGRNPKITYPHEFAVFEKYIDERRAEDGRTNKSA